MYLDMVFFEKKFLTLPTRFLINSFKDYIRVSLKKILLHLKNIYNYKVQYLFLICFKNTKKQWTRSKIKT